MRQSVAHFEEHAEEKIRRKAVEPCEHDQPAEACQAVHTLARRLRCGSPRIVGHGASPPPVPRPEFAPKASTGSAPART